MKSVRGLTARAWHAWMDSSGSLNFSRQKVPTERHSKASNCSSPSGNLSSTHGKLLPGADAPHSCF